MIVGISSWNTLISSVAILLRFMIMPFPFLLPHLGSISAIAQNSYKGLGWSKVSRLNGEHVYAQFPLTVPHGSLHTGKTLLQLAFFLVTSLSLMQLLEFTCQYFLATLHG